MTTYGIDSGAAGLLREAGIEPKEVQQALSRSREARIAPGLGDDFVALRFVSVSGRRLLIVSDGTPTREHALDVFPVPAGYTQNDPEEVLGLVLDKCGLDIPNGQELRRYFLEEETDAEIRSEIVVGVEDNNLTVQRRWRTEDLDDDRMLILIAYAYNVDLLRKLF